MQDQVRTFRQTVDTGVASPTAAAVRASLAYDTDTDHANALDRTYPPVTGDDVRQGTAPMRPGVAHFRIGLAEVAAGLDADAAVPTDGDEPAPEDEEPDELFRGLEHERR